MNEDINVGKDFNGFQPTTPATNVRIPSDGPTQFIDPPAGPKNVSEMTDRELLEELVMTGRTIGAAMATIQKVGPVGMMKAMMTGKLGA